MNWVDIKYTQDSIKKDAENGNLIPKLSNQLTSWDYEKEITIPPSSVYPYAWGDAWDLGEGAFITVVMSEEEEEYASGVFFVRQDLKNNYINSVTLTSRPYYIQVKYVPSGDTKGLRLDARQQSSSTENIVVRLYVKKIC
jgi:hypothetical protein